MQFSRAVAHAAFTALKWLAVIAAVLFAALALRFHYDGDGSAAVFGSLGSAAGSLVAAMILHRLATAIMR